MNKVAPTEPNLHRNQAGFLASIISLVFGIIFALLAIRFVLHLLGADPANQFANFIYSWSQPLVSPFYGLFHIPTEPLPRIEIPTIIALIVYGLIASIAHGSTYIHHRAY